MISKKCVTCNSVFSVDKCREYTAKYCSRKCKRHTDETKIKMKKNHLDFSGEKHPRWIGGRIKSKGYVRIYAPHHPNRDKNNKVNEHRYLVERYIGRYLYKTEQIHHINGNKDDNRLENLYIFNSCEDHSRFETTSRYNTKVELKSNLFLYIINKK